MNRYNRNKLIEGVGEEGQQKLLQAKVLVVGAGGLGSPVLYYLAAAGVGTLGVIDYDTVDETNLQRQILHRTADVGRSKVESAAEKLRALNPDICINTYNERLTDDNADELIAGYDFIADCSDSYASKLLINDVCVRNGKPYSHAAVLAMRGELMTYLPGCACYRCVFEDEPAEGSHPGAAQVGILGAVAGVIGSLQAAEVVKYFTGIGELVTNRILIYDGLRTSFYSLKASKRKECGCCSR